MKVKRIFAPDMRQAMKRVREEIGVDAVIVSNHRIAGGVEVVAAHEQDFEAAQAEFKREQSVKRRLEEQVQLLSGDHSPGLVDEMRKARGAVLSAEGEQQDVGYSPQNYRPEKALRSQQLETSYEDELQSILESLKQRQEGQAERAVSNSREQRQAARPEPRFSADEPLQNPLDGNLSQAQQLAKRFNVQESSSLSSMDDDEMEYRDAADDYREDFALDDDGRSAQQQSLESRMGQHREQELISSMQKEIQHLQSMLERQLPGAYQPQGASGNSRVVDKLATRYERMGIGKRLASRLFAHVEPGLDLNKAWRNTLGKLVEMVPVMGEDYIDRGGMIAFVGPTGVGKTTTIGKLAARYVLKNGSANVALVTTDSYRIAAHEQLRTFGRILDIPVRVVDERNSLSDVLLSLRNKRLVLIDTAGMSLHEQSSQDQKIMLDSAPVRLKKLLVLSCSSQHQVLEDAYDNYRTLGLNGCVLTKLDESGNLGAALTLVAEAQLPVSYIACGQKVPDDLEVAQRNDLVSRAVVIAQKSRERERQRALFASGEGSVPSVG